jgi:hypothetical protein
MGGLLHNLRCCRRGLRYASGCIEPPRSARDYGDAQIRWHGFLYVPHYEQGRDGYVTLIAKPKLL